jgi:hypothetical protein
MVRTLLITLLALASLAGAEASDLRAVQDVLEKYRSVRPVERELPMYSLDWASTLDEARAKAAREQRPIFFLVVTNSYGNIYTGHC